MWELILPLLLKFLPYILGAIGVAMVYFGIKRKGVLQERERQEAKQAEAKAAVVKKVAAATAKDEDIDRRVSEDVAKAKAKATADEAPVDITPGSQFKF
jgi:hypothetical protein